MEKVFKVGTFSAIPDVNHVRRDGEGFAVDNNSLMETKSRLRAALDMRRKALCPADVEIASARICGWLVDFAVVDSARWVAVYAATPGEVNLQQWIEYRQKCEKGVLLPRFDSLRGDYTLAPVRDWEQDTVVGKFGIREARPEVASVAWETLADGDVIWFVPGLGFDRSGRRLGRGRGYYDRLLLGVGGLKIGVALDWQIVPEIPAEAHDIRMDLIVTETELVRCRPA